MENKTGRLEQSILDHLCDVIDQVSSGQRGIKDGLAAQKILNALLNDTLHELSDSDIDYFISVKKETKKRRKPAGIL